MKISKKLIVSAVVSALSLQISMVQSGANRSVDPGKTNVYVTAATALGTVVVGVGAYLLSRFLSQDTLFDAVKRGDVATTQSLIRSGAKVNVTNKTEYTPLHWAAYSGHEAIVSLLVGAGADVDATNRAGSTPLRMAVYSGHEAIVQLLLNAGADVDAANRFGERALRMAVYSGHEAIVQLLLNAGADVDAADNSGKTALHWAAERGREAVVRELVKAGVELHDWVKSLRFFQDNQAFLKECIDIRNVRLRASNRWINELPLSALLKEREERWSADTEKLPNDLRRLVLKFVLTQPQLKQLKELEQGNTRSASSTVPALALQQNRVGFEKGLFRSLLDPFGPVSG